MANGSLFQIFHHTNKINIARGTNVHFDEYACLFALASFRLLHSFVKKNSNIFMSMFRFELYVLHSFDWPFNEICRAQKNSLHNAETFEFKNKD